MLKASKLFNGVSMKTLLLAALFISPTAFADNRDIVEIDPKLMTLTFVKNINLPAVADEEELPIVKAGLPAVKGQAACILVANSKVAKKKILKTGTVLKVEGIMADYWSDTGLNIIKPVGWGIGISCVSKLKGFDAETGYPETKDPKDSITVSELRAALKGVIEVKIK